MDYESGDEDELLFAFELNDNHLPSFDDRPSNPLGQFLEHCDNATENLIIFNARKRQRPNNNYSLSKPSIQYRKLDHCPSPTRLFSSLQLSSNSENIRNNIDDNYIYYSSSSPSSVSSSYNDWSHIISSSLTSNKNQNNNNFVSLNDPLPFSFIDGPLTYINDSQSNLPNLKI